MALMLSLSLCENSNIVKPFNRYQGAIKEWLSTVLLNETLVNTRGLHIKWPNITYARGINDKGHRRCDGQHIEKYRSMVTS